MGSEEGTYAGDGQKAGINLRECSEQGVAEDVVCCPTWRLSCWQQVMWPGSNPMTCDRIAFAEYLVETGLRSLLLTHGGLGTGQPPPLHQPELCPWSDRNLGTCANPVVAQSDTSIRQPQTS